MSDYIRQIKKYVHAPEYSMQKTVRDEIYELFFVAENIMNELLC